MNQVIIDQSTSEKLALAGEPVELRDTTGRLLGYFHPPDDDLYGGYESPTSAEELERRAHEGGGRSLKEIMADLEKRS